MLAAVYHGPGDLRLEDMAEPSAGPGDVVIRVEAVLTCGTDLKTIRRGHPYVRPPRVLGHEYSGVVVEAGEGSGFSVGERVTGVNSGPCQQCRYCLKGRENLCETLDRELVGFTVDGAYAQLCRIPRRVARVNLHRMPDGLGFVEAAFLEPLSCVVHGLSVATPIGEKIAILGGGPIGLLHLQTIKSMQPTSHVTVFDPHQEKLSVATRLGADETVEAVGTVWDRYVGVFDTVVESVGRVEAWERAVQLVDKGGTVLFFGGCPRDSRLELDTYKTHYGELRLLGAFHHTPRDVRRALELISRGGMRLTQLINYEKPLSGILEVYDSLSRGEAVKILIRP
ncbi:MAG: alcohol dehydrogenase catalytic domain-containing protein [Nitrososphaerota archaeon]